MNTSHPNTPEQPSQNGQDPDNPDTEREPSDRLSVVLNPAAAKALANLQDRTSMKKVDVANRALTIFDYFESELRDGCDIILRAPDGHEQRIKLFI